MMTRFLWQISPLKKQFFQILKLKTYGTNNPFPPCLQIKLFAVQFSLLGHRAAL